MIHIDIHYLHLQQGANENIYKELNLELISSTPTTATVRMKLYEDRTDYINSNNTYNNNPTYPNKCILVKIRRMTI